MPWNALSHSYQLNILSIAYRPTHWHKLLFCFALCCQLCIHTLKLCWKEKQGPKKRLPQWFYCRKMDRKKRRLQHRLFITPFVTFKSFGSGCWVCCCMSACCLCRCPQRTKVVLTVMWFLSWPPRYHNAVVLLCNKDLCYWKAKWQQLSFGRILQQLSRSDCVITLWC